MRRDRPQGRVAANAGRAEAYLSLLIPGSSVAGDQDPSGFPVRARCRAGVRDVSSPRRGRDLPCRAPGGRWAGTARRTRSGSRTRSSGKSGVKVLLASSDHMVLLRVRRWMRFVMEKRSPCPFEGRAPRRDPPGCPRGDVRPCDREGVPGGTDDRQGVGVARAAQAAAARASKPGTPPSLPPSSPGHHARRVNGARDHAGPHIRDARPARTPASRQNHAAIAARPWLSVGTPTVRTDRPDCAH